MNNKNLSGITVGIPFYSMTPPNELIQSIHSILNQTLRPNKVHLIQDGNVNDDIKIIIDRYKKNNLFELIILPKVGLPAALNVSIKMTKTKYYARMDSDDMAFKDRFEKQINMMKKDNIKIIGSYALEFEENINNEDLFVKEMPSSSKSIENFFHYRNPLIHSSVIFDMDVFNTIGYYNEKYLTGQDLELWSRALKHKVKISNIAEPLIYFRMKKEITILRRATWSSIINQTKARYNYNTLSIKLNILKIGAIIFRLLPYQFQKWSYLKIR